MVSNFKFWYNFITKNIINNKILPKKQRPGGSYFGKLDSKVFINWKDSAESIKNQVKSLIVVIFSTYLSAYNISV